MIVEPNSGFIFYPREEVRFEAIVRLSLILYVVMGISFSKDFKNACAGETLIT